jgi:HEAT repeat protein
MPRLPLPFSNQSAADWIVQFQNAADAEQRLRALQAIGVVCPPEEIVQWASKALHDVDPVVRALAAKLSGNPALPLSTSEDVQLFLLLADADPDVRFESSRALIRRKSAQANAAFPILFSFLDEPETHALMVAAVVSALIEAELPPGVVVDELQPRIQKLLEHERAEVREAIAHAFARWPVMVTSLSDQLIPLLDDSEPIVREKIAHAFGQAGVFNGRIKVALESASQDEDTEVAREAADALKAISPEPIR